MPLRTGLTPGLTMPEGFVSPIPYMPLILIGSDNDEDGDDDAVQTWAYPMPDDATAAFYREMKDIQLLAEILGTRNSQKFVLKMETWGLEPQTFCIQRRCSDRLSYIPNKSQRPLWNIQAKNATLQNGVAQLQNSLFLRSFRTNICGWTFMIMRKPSVIFQNKKGWLKCTMNLKFRPSTYIPYVPISVYIA